MEIENINRITISNNITSKNNNLISTKSFLDVLSEKNIDYEYILSASSYSSTNISYDYCNYNNKLTYTSNFSEIETENYSLNIKNNSLYIYEKNTDNRFIWNINESFMQSDSISGEKFLIKDFGGGCLSVFTMNSELESAIKTTLNTDTLPEEPLADNLIMNQDLKTGIYYITSLGFEDRGGYIVETDTAKQTICSMADNYLKKYPNICQSEFDGFFYAKQVVMGFATDTGSGFLLANSEDLQYIDNNDTSKNWYLKFKNASWDMVQQWIDELTNTQKNDDKNVWSNFLQNKQIEFI